MHTINIKFQAYIPKSLGKSLLSYFQSDSRFNPRDMLNYGEFKRNLENADRHGYKWLPEPGNFASNYFFGTDNVNFHNSHSKHDVRLSLNMNLEIARIGRFTLFDQNDIFYHSSCGNNNQHSDKSHRIEAFIRNKVPLYYGGSETGVVPTGMKYEGVCNGSQSLASKEKPLKKSIRNTVSGTYFSQQGKSVKEDTTIIEASASAGYPFLEHFAQDIDFKIVAKLYLNGKTVQISIDGEHNDFPAYELLIDNQVIYNYDPTKHGYSGPTPYNLGMASTKFRSSKSIHLDDWQVKSIEQSKEKNQYGRRY
ncbi:hypothetical protein NTJ12_002246 [Flavobacterium psychrophilum]|jgi:hypothetical protein|nr:hypothetical protein [Flavobacterium psychrophilum]